MERKGNKIAIIIVVVTYLVGIVGFMSPHFRPIFLWLVPFHLLLVFGLLMWQHQDWNASFWVFLFVVYLLTFWAEFVGVHTGLLFGDYYYGHVLGFKFLEIPLMIGVNWLLLAYCTFSISSYLFRNKWLVVFFSAVLLLGIDVLIEPVAIKYDFWQWKSGEIPIYNYSCWFVLGLVVSFLASKCKIWTNTVLASTSFLMQVCFFVFLR